jgi:hypothetical protein
MSQRPSLLRSHAQVTPGTLQFVLPQFLPKSSQSRMSQRPS